MGRYIAALLLILAALAQNTFLPQIRIRGGMPDLVFLFVLAWAIRSSFRDGLIIAFIGGITLDLVTVSPTGATPLAFTIILYAVELVRGQVFKIGFFSILLLVIGGTLFIKVMHILIMLFSGFRIAPLEMLTYTIIPTIAYNLVLIWPILWLTKQLQSANYRSELTER